MRKMTQSEILINQKMKEITNSYGNLWRSSSKKKIKRNLSLSQKSLKSEITERGKCYSMRKWFNSNTDTGRKSRMRISMNLSLKQKIKNLKSALNKIDDNTKTKRVDRRSKEKLKILEKKNLLTKSSFLRRSKVNNQNDENVNKLHEILNRKKNPKKKLKRKKSKNLKKKNEKKKLSYFEKVRLVNSHHTLHMFKKNTMKRKKSIFKNSIFNNLKKRKNTLQTEKNFKKNENRENRLKKEKNTQNQVKINFNDSFFEDVNSNEKIDKKRETKKTNSFNLNTIYSLKKPNVFNDIVVGYKRKKKQTIQDIKTYNKFIESIEHNLK